MLPEPGSLVRVSGEGQVGRVGGRLPQPLVVAVRDSQGQPVPGILVTFRVLEGTGVVSPATIVTGADGQASTILTLGSVAGPNMVQAQVEGLGEVSVHRERDSRPEHGKVDHRLGESSGGGAGRSAA